MTKNDANLNVSDKSPGCKGCGAELAPNKYQGNPKKWCSNKCRYRWNRANNPRPPITDEQRLINNKRRLDRLRAKRASELQAKRNAGTILVCKNCDTELKSQTGNSSYCNLGKCRSAKAKEYLKNRRYGVCSKDGCTKGIQNVTLQLCPHHATAIWREKNPERYREISRRSRQKRRAVEKNAFVEKVDNMAIFERDKWTCWLCNTHIDKDKDYRDPMSPSIDHVIPLDKGGLHMESNIKAAHMGCNASKGNRLIAA